MKTLPKTVVSALSGLSLALIFFGLTATPSLSGMIVALPVSIGCGLGAALIVYGAITESN